MPFPKTGFQISPILSKRFKIVNMVKLLGSKLLVTSLQCKGVETVAPGRGLTEYTEAKVAPDRFCK